MAFNRDKKPGEDTIRRSFHDHERWVMRGAVGGCIALLIFVGKMYMARFEKMEDRLDAMNSRMWALDSWSKDRINELRIANDMPIAQWPDLGD